MDSCAYHGIVAAAAARHILLTREQGQERNTRAVLLIMKQEVALGHKRRFQA